MPDLTRDQWRAKAIVDLQAGDDSERRPGFYEALPDAELRQWWYAHRDWLRVRDEERVARARGDR
jgi:hypothetical protein